ncbi:putative colanic acid biosynthesis acetyltransferase WcaF [Abditibacterium utsteinense]|uniref:Putative colanic acid biosynthesis acetyltransferase WcaF n=1 Tax=Abditibacterium utsteinense TaxID=1960156 RepID=A0A2S8SNW2_9BACT|nr:WcaF family extracellular polysaccharide biosynthesis acetyltransferase [Abditibacterium utsteinense]PQV62481.1 putative colanic acid biosynthesis acetyltransferase WcaF [Abditibacterium utsteinense]
MNSVDLSAFDTGDYNPHRGFFIRSLWFIINALLLQNPLNPSSKIKIIVLRLFGAKVGQGVVLKPSINVKYPWLIEIGDYSWIGEHAWLDSLVSIKIGNNACLSQGVYLCTGNHDWSDPAFGYLLKPIIIGDGVWVGARATVLPGITLASHSIVAAGSVISKDTEPYGIYAGNPAIYVKQRHIKSAGRI